MTKHYNTEAIRNLLNESFSAEQFDAFCYDKFKHVYTQFSVAMTKTLRIHLLIEECDRRGQLYSLLQFVKEKNPHQYNTYHPQIFHEYKTTLVEFKSLETVDFAKLSPEQKAGLALGFQITLASILNRPLNEVEIIAMESGSIKITVRLPFTSLFKTLRMAPHFVEELGFIPIYSSQIADPLHSQIIPSLPMIESEQPLIDESGTITSPTGDEPPEILAPIINRKSKQTYPSSLVIPVKESYKWYSVSERQGDFLPGIQQGTWLLVDTSPRERYEIDDLIIVGGEDLEGSIPLQVFSQTPSYNRIYLGTAPTQTKFLREIGGRVTFLVETGIGNIDAGYIIGVVVGIWLNPSEVHSST